MAIVLNDSIQTNAPKPTDQRYYDGLSSWASTAAANAWIPITYRYIWLTVNIAGVEYRYESWVTDPDLVVKTFWPWGLTDIENWVTDFVWYQWSGLLFADAIYNSGKITNVDYFSYDQGQDVLTMWSPNNGAFDMRNPFGSFNWRPSYWVGNPWTSYMDLREDMFLYDSALDMWVWVIRTNSLRIQNEEFDSISSDITNWTTTNIYHNGDTIQFHRNTWTNESTDISMDYLWFLSQNTNASTWASTTNRFDSSKFRTDHVWATWATWYFQTWSSINAQYVDQTWFKSSVFSVDPASWFSLLSSDSSSGNSVAMQWIPSLGKWTVTASDEASIVAWGKEQFYGNVSGMVYRGWDAPWSVIQASNNFVWSVANSTRQVSTTTYTVQDSDYCIVYDVDTLAWSWTLNLTDPTWSVSNLVDISRRLVVKVNNTTSGDPIDISAADPSWFEEPTATGVYATSKQNQVVVLIKRFDPAYWHDRWFIESDTQPIAYTPAPTPWITWAWQTNAVAVWSSTTNVWYDGQFLYNSASLKETLTAWGTTWVANANSWYEGTRSVNWAAQFNIRNFLNGNAASAGFIITGDNWTDSVNFTEFGRNSSTYNQASQNFVLASAGYILQDAADFGIAVNSGTFKVNVWWYTTTQTKIQATSQNIQFTNNWYAHVWTNATNSTRWSDSMTNSASWRTVNLRTLSNSYTWGWAVWTSWYMNQISNTWTPWSNVTTWTFSANLFINTLNINTGRTVALSDFMGANETTSLSNSWTLSIAWSVRWIAAGKIYQTAISSTTATITLPANWVASCFSIISDVSPIAWNVLKSAHVIWSLWFNHSALNKTWWSRWLIWTSNRNYIGWLMVGTDWTYASANIPSLNYTTTNPNALLNVRSNYALGRQDPTLYTADFTINANWPVMYEIDSSIIPWITVTLPSGAAWQDLTFTITDAPTWIAWPVTISAPWGTLIDWGASITMPAFGTTWSLRTTLTIRSTRDWLNRKTISSV